MPRSTSGPSPEQFAERLRSLILRARPSVLAACEEIQAHYPEMRYETLHKYLRPRKARGQVLPPQVPSWAQLYRIVEVLEIDPAELFAPFTEPGEE